MRAVRALSALIVLLAVLVGLPWALAVTVGNPVHAWSALRAGDMSDSALIAVLAAIAYLAVAWAWASFLLAFLLTLIEATRARLAHRDPRVLQIPTLGIQLDLARAAVTALLLLAPTVAGTAAGLSSAHAQTAPPAAAQLSAHGAVSATLVPAANRLAHTGPPGSRPAATVGPQAAGEHALAGGQTYRIPEHGGLRTYWAMAEQFYGNPYLWPHIWHANQGRTQSDGSVMGSPNLLRRGWAIIIPPAPATATSPAGTVTVQPGECLSEIADDHHVSEQALWEANRGEVTVDGRVFNNPNLIWPNQKLRLPVRAASPARPGPTTVPPVHTTSRPHTPRSADRPTSQPRPTTPAHPIPLARPAENTPAEAPHAESPAAARPAHSAPTTQAGFPVWAEVVSAAGGGLLLWAGVAAALRVRRQRQFRVLRIGHTVAASPPQVEAVEKTTMRYGPAGVEEKRFLDHALRTLTRGHASQASLPRVAGARLSGGQLALRLAEPHPVDPPGPWQVDASGMWWTINHADPLPIDDTNRDEQLAPYPSLVAVGYRPAVGEADDQVDAVAPRAGERWLLDLEQAGTVALTGDPARCLDLGRFLAADLALNGHADHLRVTMVGFGAELVPLNPARLHHVSDLAEATRLAAADLAHADLAAEHGQVDVLRGRARDVCADSFMPHVLLIAPTAGPQGGELDELLAGMNAHTDRTPVAVVLAGDRAETPGAAVQLRIDEHGALSIPSLDLQLTAQALPADEAAGIAAMITHAETAEHEPMPADTSTRPGARFSDVAGGLRTDLTLPRHSAQQNEDPEAGTAPSGAAGDSPSVDQCRTLLPGTDEEYLRAAATTEQDLADAGRRVPVAVTEQVIAELPQLDQDYELWQRPDGQCPLPRLGILGPIRLRPAAGKDATNRPILVELAVFIATRDHGATVEQIAAAFGMKVASARARVNELRTLLGDNPRTGRPHVTDARTSPTSQARGVGVYEIEDLLIDIDLFRQLRTRGEARGAEHGGLEDLERALGLVTGEPFSQLPPGRYEWLEDDPLRHWLPSAITAIEQALNYELVRRAEYDRAETAAVIALKAAPYEERPQLDLAAVIEALSSRSAAEAHVRDAVCNYDDDGLGPREVSERTRAVLRNRGWLTGTGS